MKLASSLFALLVLTLLTSLMATTVEPPDFASLVKEAEAIFRGRVINVRSAWVGTGDRRHIRTYVTCDVLRALKGDPSSPFVIEMLGGTVGNETMEVVGSPTFKVGETSLLFVQNNGKQFVPLVGIMHGRFRIIRDSDTGDEILLMHDGAPLTGTDEIDRLHAKGPVTDHDDTRAASGPQPKKKPMKRDDFEDQVIREVKFPKTATPTTPIPNESTQKK